MKSIAILTALLLLSTYSFSQEFTWVKSMGGTTIDGGRAIASDLEGNVYVAGEFTNTADFDPDTGTYNLTSAGGSDIFLAKMDADGNLIWAKQWGSLGAAGVTALRTDVSGNIYLAGIFYGTVDFDPGIGIFNMTATDYDLFIMKLDDLGNFVWTKALVTDGSMLNGSINSIASDGAGNVYLAGWYGGTVDFDTGSGTYDLTSSQHDIFISKLDISGNFVWVKSVGGTSMDFATSIAIDNIGNLYATGNFSGEVDFDPGSATYNLTSSSGTFDIFILKLNASGNFIWAKSAGANSDEDVGNSVAIDVSGNVYVTGQFGYTVDFDPGNGTYDLTSTGASDVFLLKLSGLGNFLWAKAIGGASYDIGYSLALDTFGNSYIAGYFNGNSDFDPGIGTYNLTSNGSYDIFVLKLNASGNFGWAISAGGAESEYAYALTLDDSNNVLITGEFASSTLNFDSLIMTNSGTETDILVAKISNCMQSSVSISPISPLCNGGLGGATLTASEATEPYTFNWSTGSTEQNLNNVLSGIYAVTVSDALSCTVLTSVTISQPTPVSLDTYSTEDNSGTTNCDGTAYASANGGTSPYTYIWNDTSTTSSIYNLCQGWYEVTVTDTNGCMISDSVYVDFFNSINDLVESNSLKIYPNPATDKLTITNPSNKKSTLQIIDAVGRVVKSLTIEPNNKQTFLDVSDFANGFYNVQIIDASLAVTRSKLVVLH